MGRMSQSQRTSPGTAGQSVAVGVDGSEGSWSALGWAADEAHRRGVALEVICAGTSASAGRAERTPTARPAHGLHGLHRPSPQVLDDALAWVADRRPEVPVHAARWAMRAGSALCDMSEVVSLLVVGARGSQGRGGLPLGSVSEHCIHHAHCPVVVVRGSAGPPDAVPGHKIVVGVDGSTGSSRAVRWALTEAGLRHAAVEALYAWQYPPVGSFLIGPHQGYRTQAGEVVEAARSLGRTAPAIEFAARDRLAPAVPALVDAADGAELLVVGSSGRGAVHDALLGSVALACAHEARCPVVVVRGDAAPSPSFATVADVADVEAGSTGDPGATATSGALTDRAGRSGR